MAGAASTSGGPEDAAGARFARRRLLAGGLGVAMATMTPAPAASAASASSASPVRAALAVPAATPKSSSACGKVTAESVAAIVGHATPALGADFSNARFPATKASGGVSGVATQCDYGKAPAIIILFLAVTSKPPSVSVLESATKTSAASGGEKVKITSYSGLGIPGFLVSVGSSNEAIGLSGTTEFRATAYSLPLSKLAALAKLARKL
ncbi:MAG TPA: hypothetical protein VIJ34_16960 [Acidimicrobiales bacterium]